MANKFSVSQIKTLVILGSTRDGRMGEKVANWFMNQVEGKYPEMEFELIDLKEIDLPLYHDAVTPGSTDKKYSDPKVTAWSQKVDKADAFVIISPEYNHGYSAPLKNALDTLYLEWNKKAVSFVSYGGISGGIRAVEQLRQVAVELEMAPIRQAIHIPFARSAFGEEDSPKDAAYIRGVESLVKSLEWWAKALKEAREK